MTSEASELSESTLVNASLAVKNMADYMSSLDTSNMTISELEEQAGLVTFKLVMSCHLPSVSSEHILQKFIKLPSKVLHKLCIDFYANFMQDFGRYHYIRVMC